MRLQQFLEMLDNDEVPVVKLDNNKIRHLIDADNTEGWVIIPDLSSLPDPQDTVKDLGEVELQGKKLFGKVEFNTIKLPK